MGLVSPLTMKAKLLLRRTHAGSKGWDEELPVDIKGAWGELVSELDEAGTLFFPRSTVPPRKEVGEPLLVGFGDGSLEGFMALVYAVWPLEGGGAEVYPILAKARVSPLGGTTTPRMEMSSAALLGRLTVLVARNAGFKPAEVVLGLDSECTVAALQRRGGTLKPYFAHRAAEVEDALVELRQQAIQGEENPADIGTRGRATVLDLSPTSRYQRGPDFLQRPREEWLFKSGNCDNSSVGEGRQAHVVSCYFSTMLVNSIPGGEASSNLAVLPF